MHMRVRDLFNRILGVRGASVESVSLVHVGVVIRLRRPRRMLVCPCGGRSWSRYDSSRRRWRHLDAGVCKVFVEADICRVDCRRCGRVRTEVVPWARAGARHTWAFEQTVGWLVQRMDKSAVSRLMRCSWEAVDAIAARVVADNIDDSRFDGVERIGVDEISYKRGHQYLTVVVDHDSGDVLWVVKDRTKESFASFFEALGPERSAGLTAITLDARSVDRSVAAEYAPQAQICIDPFHVIKWCNESLDYFFRSQPTVRVGQGRGRGFVPWRRLRFALWTGKENLSESKRALISRLRRVNRQVYRCWELKEELRELYRSVAPGEAAAYLEGWCRSALRTRIPSMQRFA